MATRTQKIKLGIFLAASGGLFITTVLVFAGLKMFDAQVRYYVRFSESVSGLEKGAPVKLRGVRVGSVSDVVLDPDNIEQVRVSLDLTPRTPVKTDSRASLKIAGITGLKYVEIRDGTDEAKPLPPGSFIPEGESIMSKITGSAEDISLKAEKVLNNLLMITGEANRHRIARILDHAADLTKHVDQLTLELKTVAAETGAMLKENRAEIRRTLANVDRTTGGVANMVENANTMIEGVDTAALEQSVESLTVTLNTFRGLLERVARLLDQNQDQVRATIYNLRITAESLKEFGRSLQRKPSLLLFDDDPKERSLP